VKRESISVLQPREESLHKGRCIKSLCVAAYDHDNKYPVGYTPALRDLCDNQIVFLD